MNRILILEFNDKDGKVANTYKVEYPTVKEMIDIESMKLALSKGKYTEMIMSGTKWMARALNYVDMLAYLSVMCPKLISDSKVSLTDIDLLDAHEGLLKSYQEQFLPWWNEYEVMINKIENGEDSEEGDTTENKS